MELRKRTIKTRITRLIVGLSLAIGMALAWLPSAHSQAGATRTLRFAPGASFILSGRLLPWRLEMSTQWAGGNFYELDEVIHDLDDVMRQALGGVLEKMRETARHQDATLLHLGDFEDFAGKKISRKTSLIIGVVDNNLTADEFKKKEDAIWDEWLNRVVWPEASKGAQIDVGRVTDEIHVGGLRAYQTIFVFRNEPNGDWCQIVTFVPLGRRGMHLFLLRAAISLCDQRREEILNALKKLRYDPILHEELRK